MRGIKMTTSEFIVRSNEIHFDKFDYSKVNYINMKNKVVIVCKIHGEFLQNPNNHLNGQGCLKCSNDFKRGDILDFIERSKIKHSDKYDYSSVEYKSAFSKVSIICREHGIFKQTPNSHLSGSGCFKCCKSSKIDLFEFIKRANIKHNYKYDYSSTIYVNSKDNVDIICKEHGSFSQIPRNHLMGNGCPSCGTLYGIKENKWLDSFNCVNRQVKIDKYFVDGYDPDTKTIYEFNGDFWHGNPKKYNKDDINSIVGKTFGELYEMTMKKRNNLEELGYKVISIWESDF